jgi:hypothetical protein
MNITLKKLRDLTRKETVQDNDILLVYSPETGKTHFVLIRDLLLADGTFPSWSSDDVYAEGDQVQYALRLWESLVDDNEGNVPTEGANWTEVSPDEVVVSVLDQVLTGLSTGSNADVTAANTILEAIGRLQANKQRTIFKDGSQAMEANLDMNSNKILQVAAATANGEAVNFEQLNAAIDGLKPKADCRVATTADITLNDEQTIDGIAVVDGDRVLVKDQADASQNGILICVAGDDWIRATDADSAIELQGALVQIEEGTVNAGTAWTQYSVDITLGTTDILWRQIGSVVPDATDTTKGKAKLYVNLLASNTDGSVSQAAIVSALNALAIVIQNSTSQTVPISGTDTYTGNLSPAITSYVKGQTFKLTDVNANTVTNPTINLNSLGAKNIVNYKNAALTVGDFVGTVIVMYDGTAFRMIGGGGGGGGLLADNNLSDLVNAATARTNLGGTTVGQSIFTAANPGAIRFIRINADNTITFRTAAEILADIYAAPTNDPTFTGTVTVPTPTAGDSSTKAASTAFVQTEIATFNKYVKAVATMYNLTF